jgi:hypothetical protein
MRDNNKIDLQEVEWEDMDWVYLISIGTGGGNW